MIFALFYLQIQRQHLPFAFSITLDQIFGAALEPMTVPANCRSILGDLPIPQLTESPEALPNRDASYTHFDEIATRATRIRHFRPRRQLHVCRQRLGPRTGMEAYVDAAATCSWIHSHVFLLAIR